MKLRNKKTGEIKSIEEIIRDAFLSNELDSLKNIDANWEDVEEPLIKDEKIRKAVRAWWDCCQEGIEDKRIYIKDAEFRMGIYRLDLGRYYFFDDKKEGFYTITELCGEEEE